MIFVRLKGGLGNQLFQYAAARRLALVHGVELRLDITPLEDSPNRSYQLGVFSISSAVATPSEVAARLGSRGIFHWPRRSRMPCVRETAFRFDPSILDAPDEIYLDGYWQSERYFEDAAAVIRSEISFRSPPAGPNAEMYEEIKSTPASVSVHVRRGDYVSQPEAQRVLGTCDPEYYSAAAAYLLKHLADQNGAGDARFFVFSDDPGWVRQNLRLPGRMTVVAHNGPETAYEDLRLMSGCQYHIIANSTFSWWGAWLASDLNKVVIAPKRWFRAPEYSDKDLIPSRWIRL